MRIMLVGGSGTLSSDTTRLLLKEGHEVYLFNRGNRNIFSGNNLHYIKGDINDTDNSRALLKDYQFDVIIDYLTFDVQTLRERIDLFRKKCTQYVFISSATIFKNTEKIIDEKSEKGNDEWRYSKNKLLCEKYLINNVDELGFHYTTVRPYITYDDRRIPFPVVTKKSYWTLIDRIYNEKPVLICDDGEAKLTLTHTMDFAVGITGLLLNKDAFEQDFNIVGDTVGTWNDIISVIEEYTKKKAKVVYVDSIMLGNAFLSQKMELLCDKSHSHVFNNQKIKRIVPEFHTSWNLHDGLYHTLDYLHSHDEMHKIDRYWNNTIDVLAAKFSDSGEYKASLKKRAIYLLQENKYIRTIGRTARKLGIWDY